MSDEGCKSDLTLLLAVVAVIISVIGTCNTCSMNLKDRELTHRPYMSADTYYLTNGDKIYNQISLGSFNNQANMVYQKFMVTFNGITIDSIETDSVFIVNTGGENYHIVTLPNFSDCLNPQIQLRKGSNCHGAIRDIYIEYTSVYTNKRYTYKSLSTWVGNGWRVDMAKSGIAR